jgi:hypothetical protein
VYDRIFQTARKIFDRETVNLCSGSGHIKGAVCGVEQSRVCYHRPHCRKPHRARVKYAQHI